MSDFSVMDLAELKEYFSQVFIEVQVLVGLAVDHRCGICQRLASAHMDGDVTGCANKQIDEEAIKSSLILQIKSMEDLLGRLRAVSSLSRQVSMLSDLNDNLQKAVADQQDVMSRQKQSISDMQAAQDNLVGRVCYIWESYHSGLLDYPAVLEKLKKDYGYSLPHSGFSHSSTPSTHSATIAPMAPAPAAAPAAAPALVPAATPSAPPATSVALPPMAAAFPAASAAFPKI